MSNKEEIVASTEEVKTSLEFANEHLSVIAYHKPACRVELEVTLFESLVQRAHKEAVKVVSKEVSIPGFRKGRGPNELVIKNYPQAVEKEWKEKIAQLAAIEGQKLTGIHFLNGEPRVSYNLKSHSETQALVLISFETEPTVPSIDPKEIVLKEVEAPLVNEEKVSETIRQMQFFFAQWTKISEEPIKEGHFVTLDVETIEDPLPVKVFSNVRFEVTDRTMAKWMKDLVLGHTKGEILEGLSIPDSTASAKEKEELSEKKVRVTIKEIEMASLPDLDAGFAHRVGASSVEEMHQTIEKLLQKKSQDHVKEATREQVSQILLSRYPFEIPFSLIEKETRFRVQQLLTDPEFKNSWEKMTKEAKNRTVSSIAEQSGKAVRMFYICKKILGDAKLSVSSKDLLPAANTPLQALLGEANPVHPQEDSQMHQAEVFSRLLLEKAEDFIIANATIEK